MRYNRPVSGEIRNQKIFKVKFSDVRSPKVGISKKQSLKSAFPAPNNKGMIVTESSNVALFGGPQSQPNLNKDIDIDGDDDANNATFGKGN